MSATLDTIDSAIMAALVPLVKTPANPTGVVKHLDRWAGEITSIEAMGAFVLNSNPAVLVGLERDEAVVDERGNKQLSGRREDVSRATFMVILILQNTRQQVAPVLKGNAGAYVGAHGAYVLAGLIKARLSNLFIAGTHRGKPVRYMGTEPFLVEAGTVYSLALRFTAEYVEADAPLPTGDEVAFDDFASVINRADPDVDTDPDNPDPTNPLQNPRVEVDLSIPST